MNQSEKTKKMSISLPLHKLCFEKESKNKKSFLKDRPFYLCCHYVMAIEQCYSFPICTYNNFNLFYFRQQHVSVPFKINASCDK